MAYMPMLPETPWLDLVSAIESRLKSMHILIQLRLNHNSRFAFSCQIRVPMLKRHTVTDMLA